MRSQRWCPASPAAVCEVPAKPPQRHFYTGPTRVQESSLLLRRYLQKWIRFTRRRQVLICLQDIKHRACLASLLHVFYKWFLFASRRGVLRYLERRVIRETSILLAHRFFKKWQNITQLQKKRSLQLSVLRRIRYEAERRMVKREYERWKMTVKYRKILHRSVVALSSFHLVSLLRRYFLLWIRRRRRRYCLEKLKLIRYSAERTLTRHILREWILLVSRHIIACNLEGLTLQDMVYRFLKKWRRYTWICKSLRRIGHKACWYLIRNAFQKWKLWLVRTTVSLRLEYNNSVLLLQVYFLRWMMLHKVRRLEY
ncbi:uncharacterized protein TM35_000016610 [Trypanosoma theileri]|uniref:Uncharacterized protein n=1 Tax=Trypanosoma theileri TaxID=67003 RepID=A0A1X0PA21_9TRYP|nr:uncharacterized protein TM35_000016610 [Trypanosoma theileri]ORC93784.1 hypothetical protein TM35_000016610 [Trypanosoma theileri]